MQDSATVLARIFRAEAGRVLASLLTQCGDLELAEDALQDACLQASQQWLDAGTPENPAAWLLTVARRRMIDRLRQSSFRQKERTIRNIYQALTLSDNNDIEISESRQAIPDERLKLIFTCCHPALSEPARVALTLKTLCGLNVKEIARAYLVSEVAMNQRITRAKRKIRDSGIAYRIPGKRSFTGRLASVLSVIYLIYNESYSAYEGKTLSREDLASEAIRLARVMAKLLPRPEVIGLLALMLFNQARNAARTTKSNYYVPLAQQDRNRWDKDKIDEARTLLHAAMTVGQTGQYQIQAAISALHCEATSWQNTDWPQIQLLYQTLQKINPSPVVALNQAICSAHQGNLNAALASIGELQSELLRYQPFYAAKADILRQLGKAHKAIENYTKAIALTQNSVERDFLLKQRAALSRSIP